MTGRATCPIVTESEVDMFQDVTAGEHSSCINNQIWVIVGDGRQGIALFNTDSTIIDANYTTHICLFKHRDQNEIWNPTYSKQIWPSFKLIYQLSWGPFLIKWIKFNPSMDNPSYHTPSKVWNKFIYPFSHFSGCSIENREWISNFIPHF